MKRAQAIGAAALRRLWLRRSRRAFRAPGSAGKRRLAVDVSVICRHDAGTGIQRAVRAIWAHLSALDDAAFEVVPVYADNTRGYCYAPKDFVSRKTKLDSVPVALGDGDAFLGLDLAAHHLPHYTEQILAWRENGASVHVVIYDLLPLSRPDWFEPSTVRHFARWLDAVVKIADNALCISDSVMQELRRRIAGTAAHDSLSVSRLYLSGDIAGSLPSSGMSPEVLRILERARSRRTALMIGTVEPRKGYGTVLDAFDKLWGSASMAAPELVIIGKPGWKTADLQQRIRTHPEYGRCLQWLEDISDEALTHFYGACSAVISASHDEGLGLPLLEAAMHRRWLLARDVPVFREQNLPNVRFFSDDRAAPLARDIESIIARAAAGPPPAAELPGWGECVERLIDVIGLSSSRNFSDRAFLRIVS